MISSKSRPTVDQQLIDRYLISQKPISEDGQQYKKESKKSNQILFVIPLSI